MCRSTLGFFFFLRFLGAVALAYVTSSSGCVSVGSLTGTFAAGTLRGAVSSVGNVTFFFTLRTAGMGVMEGGGGGTSGAGVVCGVGTWRMSSIGGVSGDGEVVSEFVSVADVVGVRARKMSLSVERADVSLSVKGDNGEFVSGVFNAVTRSWAAAMIRSVLDAIGMLICGAGNHSIVSALRAARVASIQTRKQR